MRKLFSKLALAAIFGIAMTFTFSCSGDDGDEGGGGGGGGSGSCSLETLDGVWEAGGGKTTVSGSTGVITTLPPDNNGVWKVGDQVWRNLTSTGNLTWSGQENVITEWVDVQLTMSADGKKLTIFYPDDGETITMSRKCNNQSGGGSSSSVKGGSSPSGGSSTFKDTRDGTTYKTVKIDKQTWMAENLKFNATGSKCYGEGGEAPSGYDDNGHPIYTTLSNAEIQDNCNNYGRLYNFETAMSACPKGWHLPSDDEWETLINYVDSKNGLCTSGDYEFSCADKYLKSKSGWNDYEDWWTGEIKSGNGEDKYGFSALPGGKGKYGIDYGYVYYHGGDSGFWFSASGYHISMDGADGWGSGTTEGYISVRCVKDN